MIAMRDRANPLRVSDTKHELECHAAWVRNKLKAPALVIGGIVIGSVPALSRFDRYNPKRSWVNRGLPRTIRRELFLLREDAITVRDAIRRYRAARHASKQQ